MQPTRIAYPTLAERLEQLRASGTTFAEVARRVRLRESTVIGWANGGEPNRRVRAAIEEHLSYDFVERRFAEAAADAQFPPADASEEVRALTTYTALHAYLVVAATQVPQDQLAAFFGFGPTNMSAYLKERRFAPERDRIAAILRRLPELPKHLSGEILSACTPKAVLGRLLRDCRQARGAQPEDYATRIGVSYDTLRSVENAGMGRHAPSHAKHGQGARHASFFFRRAEDLKRLLAFLQKERSELKLTRSASAADAATSDGAAPAVPGDREPAADGDAAAPQPRKPVMSRADVCERLRALVAQLGATGVERALDVPRSTIRNVIAGSPSHAKRTTIQRVASALTAYDRRTGGAGHSSVPVPVADVTPPPSGAPVDLAERVQHLEASLATLIERERARDGSPTTGEYTSPLSASRFQPHHDAVGDGALAAAQAEIRRVCERLGHLASIADDGHRRRVQQVLGALVDELFVTIEGFLREYPSGALVTLERQRQFHAEQRGRLMADSAAAPPPLEAPERKG